MVTIKLGGPTPVPAKMAKNEIPRLSEIAINNTILILLYWSRVRVH